MTIAKKRRPDSLPAVIDLKELSRLLSRELTGALEDALRSKRKAGAVSQLVETALLTTIERISPSRRLCIKSRRRAQGEQIKELAPIQVMDPLSIMDLKANEVIESGLVEMSLSQLYRATQKGRFYCARPHGRSHGKLYPAWQFVGPVPDVLSEMLRMLREQGENYVHARMISQADSLNELSPAEMLAGCPFSARAELHSTQATMLKLPAPERLALVKEVFEEPSREHAIG